MAHEPGEGRGHKGGNFTEVAKPKKESSGQDPAAELVDADKSPILQIMPRTRKVAVHKTLQFTALRLEENGNSTVAEGVTWFSTTGAAMVDGKGKVIGVEPGDTVITAISGRAFGSIELEVTPPMAASIEVMPNAVTLANGLTQKFSANGLNADGTPGMLPGAVVWMSSNPAVALIDSATGMATCLTKGSVGISATSGTLKGSTTLTVSDPVLTQIAVTPQSKTFAAGRQQPFIATGTFSDQTSNDVTTAVTWNSSNVSLATVTSGGLATGVAVGSATINAKDPTSTIAGTAAVTITAAELMSIILSPANPSVAAGLSQQLAATGQYTDGHMADLTQTVQWTCSPPAIATISPGGLVTTLAIGTATISAVSGMITASATLTVSAPAIQSLKISADHYYVGSGQALPLMAVATYSDRTTKTVTDQAAWQSSSTLVATVTSGAFGRGLVTGGALGKTTISAIYNGTGAPVTDQVSISVLCNFSDLGDADTQAFKDAKSQVNQLLTAFERRGNLSDQETAQLQDNLEMITQFLNNNPATPIPNFNAASKGGNSLTDLQMLGITFNTDTSKGIGPGSAIGTGSGRSNVIDSRFRAIGDYLYGPPPLVGLEHDPGTFPDMQGPNPGGLTDDQMRVAAIYGYLENMIADPPPYRTLASLATPDDNNRRAVFNRAVEAADAHFRTNRAVYMATLNRLISISQTPLISVSDLAKVAVLLVKQGMPADNPQINTWIDRALATAQNAGQDTLPSEINIDLPDLEQDVSDFEIISENIFALQPAYFCSMLEELKVFQVVEKLVELFQNGVLPVVRGDAGNLLFAYWKNAALRVSESERRGFYARTLGFPGGDADSPNRDFKDLFMRFVSAVSSFVRQNTVDNLLRSNIPSSVSQQQVRKTARDLATNLSSHGYGIAYPMATELQKEINDAMAILKNGEVQAAYGAKDVWQLVDQVAALELNGGKNSVKYRTMASAGATIFAWLAKRSRVLANNSYVPILDITQLQLAPSYSTKPTTDPSDFDLVGACDQWLAVTGTHEDSVEEFAQPNEAPVMPSRPIQIPSVAREMLESVGVPALSYAANAGHSSNGSNWRYK